jgi:hypothetical protein
MDGKCQLLFPRLRIRAVHLKACDSLSGILQERRHVPETVAVLSSCSQDISLSVLRGRALAVNFFYQFAQCSPWHQIAMRKPAYQD